MIFKLQGTVEGSISKVSTSIHDMALKSDWLDGLQITLEMSEYKSQRVD